jgi:hypothetical protein
MTRGRENAACSVTENGKRADSVRMLHLHHSSRTRLATRGARREPRGGGGLAAVTRNYMEGALARH